jgi:small subunit ribosomal protein S1
MTDTVEISAQKENTQDEMNELYETSMKSPQDGNIFKGRVIKINGETVIVDVGLKSEGKVSLSEFTNKAGEIQVSEGDEVEVMFVGRERDFGLLILSKERVDAIRVWQRIEKSLEDGTPVEGDIASEVKGGFLVDIVGVNAFLPISQVDVKPVKNPASFVVQSHQVKQAKRQRHCFEKDPHGGGERKEKTGVLEKR